jgi:hypothetical protein
MRATSKNMILFKPKIMLMTVFIILITGACLNKIESEADNKNLIPEKAFITILTDAYLADGLLTIPQLHDKFSNRDSVSTYIDIIEGHGYTYDAMNRTLKYYFIKKPKNMIRIYDEVLGKLSEMESRNELELLAVTPAAKNLWTGKPLYELNDTAGISSADFSITVNPNITFFFEFSVTIFPDDKTYNPCLISWYNNADSAETGKRTYLLPVKYIKDGRPHIYRVIDKVNFTYPVVFKGSLMNFENNPGPAGVDAIISDITFTLPYNL